MSYTLSQASGDPAHAVSRRNGKLASNHTALALSSNFYFHFLLPQTSIQSVTCTGTLPSSSEKDMHLCCMGGMGREGEIEGVTKGEEERKGRQTKKGRERQRERQR